MRKHIRAAVVCCAVLLGVTAAKADILQGFETDTNGWTNADRVASGTHGITSKSGNWHAETLDSVNNESAYVLWDVGDAMVPPGFTTSVDIYLDLSSGAFNDTRFDWDVALQTSAGGFVRDFVFNGGYYDQMSATGSGPRFVFSAGNNAGRGNAYPEDPNHDPFAITASGWYTFQHHFQDDNGVLRVDMTILDASGAIEKSWTISSGDPVGPNCCSPNYGWFATQEFEFLAFDNADLTQDAPATQVPEPATMSLITIGLAGFVRRKRRN
jgi:hypothetical protein